MEFPQGFKEIRVAEERLSHDEVEIFDRDTAQVTLARTATADAQFLVDWHLVALPLIQQQSEADPVHIFKNWLARMLILAPIPSLISGDSQGDTLMPEQDCTNFGEWFAGLLAHSPSAYSRIDSFMRQVMPDFKDIKNPIVGKDSLSLSVQFQQDEAALNLAFKHLSDGEKCFFICAVVIASNEAGGWPKVREVFQSDHVTAMQRNANRHMVPLVDFDEDSGRFDKMTEVIPEDLAERVFVIGVWSEPEDLPRAELGSKEDVGYKLASECYDDSRDVYDLLRHNADELDRMTTILRPILFPTA